MKPAGAVRLTVVPLELKTLNEMVARLHRHHKPVQGHRFSIGVVNPDGVLVGGASVGRPVARNGGAPSEVLEVTRLVTDGAPGACSALYAAAARVGRELGYRRIQTYILATEPGTSLRAAGWPGGPTRARLVAVNGSTPTASPGGRISPPNVSASGPRRSDEKPVQR